MAYGPKLSHLFKILVGRRDPQAAEHLFYEGTWLNDQGDFAGARDAFRHAAQLDPGFAGALYNVAALTERLEGKTPAALAAWRAYLAAAPNDRRQKAEAIARVREHVAQLASILEPGGQQ